MLTLGGSSSFSLILSNISSDLGKDGDNISTRSRM